MRPAVAHNSNERDYSECMPHSSVYCALTSHVSRITHMMYISGNDKRHLNFIERHGDMFCFLQFKTAHNSDLRTWLGLPFVNQDPRSLTTGLD